MRNCPADKAVEKAWQDSGGVFHAMRVC